MSTRSEQHNLVSGQDTHQQKSASALSMAPSSTRHPTLARKRNEMHAKKANGKMQLKSTVGGRRKDCDVSPFLKVPKVLKSTTVISGSALAHPREVPATARWTCRHPAQARKQSCPGGYREPQRAPKAGEVHSPHAIPQSLAALLAMTTIPRPRSSPCSRQHRIRPSRAASERMTVESIINKPHDSEKHLSLGLCKGPLGLLLTPPEELESDSTSLTDSDFGSPLSSCTRSLDSKPSLSSLSSGSCYSEETRQTPRRKTCREPTRRCLTPVSSPGGGDEDHPLSSQEMAVEDLDFAVFDDSGSESNGKSTFRSSFLPFRSAFKSNLTASLRALRQAARSLSTLNFPSIPPEDFLTRSILTLDPRVPFTDERMPPREVEPTAAMRRYLNPPTASRPEQGRRSSASPARPSVASIQLQTYRVSRSRRAIAGRLPSISPTTPRPPDTKRAVFEYPSPGPRQREMRENSDFIRIAVMEMAMRKCGKLDEQRPGRARWALAPRETSTKPYPIGADGVPARWIPITY